MDDSVIWAIAVGTGVIGLLLLGVAGAAAVYWNVLARRSKGTASADRSQSRGGDIAATGEWTPVDTSTAQPKTVPVQNPLLWIKACIFALFHASTVSIVMGGVTFFEDLVKASEEMKNEGTVSFPKQLLPGPFSPPTTPKRISHPFKDSSQAKTAAGKAGSDDALGWEVVDRVGEMRGNRR